MLQSYPLLASSLKKKRSGLIGSTGPQLLITVFTVSWISKGPWGSRDEMRGFALQFQTEWVLSPASKMLWQYSDQLSLSIKYMWASNDCGILQLTKTWVLKRNASLFDMSLLKSPSSLRSTVEIGIPLNRVGMAADGELILHDPCSLPSHTKQLSLISMTLPRTWALSATRTKSLSSLFQILSPWMATRTCLNLLWERNAKGFL